MAKCPESVRSLVERFDVHIETYKEQAYNETQVRREFMAEQDAKAGPRKAKKKQQQKPKGKKQ